MPFKASVLKPANQPPRTPRSTKDYGRQHQKWRLMVLRRSPICKCGRPATEAHHIVEIKKGGARFDLENAMACCKSCHSKITNRENREPRAMA